MLADAPDIARSCDRETVGDQGNFIGRIIFFDGIELANNYIDFRYVEAGEGDIEIECLQILQLNSKQLAVPSRVFGELIVGDDIGANLGLGQVFETDRRQPCRCRVASPPRRGRGRL